MLKLDYSSQLGEVVHWGNIYSSCRNCMPEMFSFLFLTLPAYVICSGDCPAQSCLWYSNESLNINTLTPACRLLMSTLNIGLRNRNLAAVTSLCNYESYKMCAHCAFRHCLYSLSVVEVVKEYKWIAWLCEIFEHLPNSVDHGWVFKWSRQKSLVHSAAVPNMSGWVHECFLD